MLFFRILLPFCALFFSLQSEAQDRYANAPNTQLMPMRKPHSQCRAPASSLGCILSLSFDHPYSNEIYEFIEKQAQAADPSNAYVHLKSLLIEGKIKTSEIDFLISEYLTPKMKDELHAEELNFSEVWTEYFTHQKTILYPNKVTLTRVSEANEPAVFEFVDAGIKKAFEPLDEKNFHFARHEYLFALLCKKLNLSITSPAHFAKINGRYGIVAETVESRKYSDGWVTGQDKIKLKDSQAATFLAGNLVHERDIIIDRDARLWFIRNENAFSISLPIPNASFLYGSDVPSQVSPDFLNRLQKLDLAELTAQMTESEANSFRVRYKILMRALLFKSVK